VTPRFTAHSYAHYWWIQDNKTGDAARNLGGARLIYHPRENTWEEINKARQRAQRKADKLNLAEMAA
jgi:hypothetical protein